MFCRHITCFPLDGVLLHCVAAGYFNDWLMLALSCKNIYWVQDKPRNIFSYFTVTSLSRDLGQYRQIQWWWTPQKNPTVLILILDLDPEYLNYKCHLCAFFFTSNHHCSVQDKLSHGFPFRPAGAASVCHHWVSNWRTETRCICQHFSVCVCVCFQAY